MWHDGSPPPPTRTASYRLSFRGRKKARKILETAHDGPSSRNMPDELTSALSPAVRNVEAKCHIVVTPLSNCDLDP
jgi:hypothetical protein